MPVPRSRVVVVTSLKTQDVLESLDIDLAGLHVSRHCRLPAAAVLLHEVRAPSFTRPVVTDTDYVVRRHAATKVGRVNNL